MEQKEGEEEAERAALYPMVDIKEVIGYGGSCVVYRGFYEGREVAIKQLIQPYHPDQAKYTLLEMENLRTYQRENIVPIIAVIEKKEDEVLLITELAEKGSLDKIIREAVKKNLTMKWRRRLSILRDVAKAMVYLHEKRVVHRDLKSMNVIITKNWVAKVCDFGLARSLPKGCNPTIDVGTIPWMSPEVLMQIPYGPSIDVFSFGMVIYELIFMRTPDKRKPTDGFRFKSELYAHQLPADIPQGLWELLCSCCAQKPEERPKFPKVLSTIEDISRGLPKKDTSKKQRKEKENEKEKEKVNIIHTLSLS